MEADAEDEASAHSTSLISQNKTWKHDDMEASAYSTSLISQSKKRKLDDVGTYPGLSLTSFDDDLITSAHSSSLIFQSEIGKHDDMGDALRKAAENGHIEILKLFLEKVTNLIDVCKALISAAEKGNTETVQFLLQKSDSLTRAAYTGRADVVKRLLDEGADPNKSYTLPVAVYKGHTEIVKLLIDKKADLNKGDPLGRAAGKGHTEIVKVLLEKGANPNRGDSLRRAAKKGHTEIIKVLLEKGANPNREDYLEIAAEKGHTEIVTILLDKGANHYRGEPLGRAAEKGHSEIVKLLLEKGANPNTGDPLGRAAEKGHTEIVKVLLEKGAKPYRGDPLGRAAEKGHTEIVTILLDKGADPYEGDPLGRAAEKGHTEIVKLLLEKGANPIWGDPLGRAAGKGHTEIVKVLLEKGSNPDRGDPLGRAADKGHTEIVKVLLEKGANPNRGEPLKRAAEKGHTEIVKLFLQHGANSSRTKASDEVEMFSKDHTSRMSDDPAKTLVMSDDPAQTSVMSDDTAQTSVMSDDPAQTSVMSDDPAKTSVMSDDTAQTSIMSEDPAQTSLMSDDTAKTLVMSDNQAQTSVMSDDPAKTSVMSDDTAQTSVMSEDPAQTSLMSDDTAKTLLMSDNQAQTSVMSDDPAQTLVMSDDQAQTSVMSDDTAQTSVMSDDPAQTLVMLDDPAQTLVMSDDPAQTLLISDDPAQTTVMTDDPDSSLGHDAFSERILTGMAVNPIGGETTLPESTGGLDDLLPYDVERLIEAVKGNGSDIEAFQDVFQKRAFGSEPFPVDPMLILAAFGTPEAVEFVLQSMSPKYNWNERKEIDPDVFKSSSAEIKENNATALYVATFMENIPAVKAMIKFADENNLAYCMSSVHVNDETEAIYMAEIGERLGNKYSELNPAVIPGHRKEIDGTRRRVFVVYSTEIMQAQDLEKEYIGTVMLRNPYKIDSEARIVKLKEDSSRNLSNEEIEIAQRAIQSHSSELWCNHSNLNIISVCSVRSKNRGGSVEPGLCIVLYCSTKGVVPLGEEEFPRKLDVGENNTIHTDVREGYFEFGYQTFPSSLRHTDLKMGCNIGKQPVQNGGGTLGPFIKYNDSIGFLTCAHVLFNVDSKVDFTHSEMNRVDVYQPAPSSLYPSGNACGFVQRAVFNPDLASSVDAAVVMISDEARKPVRGGVAMDHTYRYQKMGFKDLPEFNDGSTLRDPSVKAVSNMIVQFGSETHMTKGSLVAMNAEARLLSTALGKPFTQDKVCMKGQYEVEGTKSSINVFLPGDSGAAVFMLKGTTLHSIGMAIGLMSNGNAVVTPIGPVLDALSTNGNTCRIASFGVPPQPMEH